MLDNFAEKYTIDGEPGVIPIQYFENNSAQIKYFLRTHHSSKVRLVLVCLMEQKLIDEKKTIFKQDKFYFHSETYINVEVTNVKEILFGMIYEILDKIASYQRNCSGWYFKEVVNLEIHTVDYKPLKGSSNIPLPDFILKKKAIINIQNKDNKCFLWSVLRFLHPNEVHEQRLTDLKQCENELNFKDINFPVKLKYITKFESQNQTVPGINVFSVNEQNKFYPLRMSKKDCQKSIDLFLSEQDGKSHYCLIKASNYKSYKRSLFSLQEMFYSFYQERII